MALGGGTFTVQNKVLPGSYINFVSAARASAALSDRGVVALPLELDWGVEGEVFTVTVEEFEKDSLKIFGYEYSNSKLKGLRDLFKNIVEAHVYRLNTGVKAQNTYATAKYGGVRGNDIKIIIAANIDDPSKYDVTTVLGTITVDTQTVADAAGLVDNDFVTWKTGTVLADTAGTPLTGGTNGTAATGTEYQTFLDKIEAFSFNALGCLSTDPTITSLFVNFTKRLRDTVGAKFQTVLYRASTADYEGVISVENTVTDTGESAASLVYWVTGVAAGVAINQSNTNRLYDGEFTVDVNYTQVALEDALEAGKFIFHKVGDEVRVLEDINTLVTETAEKGPDFKNNQTIRVLDQIANDIAVLFNTKYLGKIPNEASGRISLWNDIVKHHQELQTVQAIEDFNPDDVVVVQGDTKKSVVVSDVVTVVNAMAQLYMTVTVQ